MTKLSKVSFFLFVSAYNYIWFRIIIFNSLYNQVGNMGLLYTIILAILVLLFFALLPKKLLEKNYSTALQKSYFKIFYAVILLLESIFSVSFCSYLLAEVFIKQANYLLIIGGMTLAIVIVSRFKPKDVIELSTLFNIMGYGILFLSFFFLPSLDLSVLFPVKNIDWWYILFFMLLIISDNFTLLIHKKDIQFHKFHFSMGLLLAIVFLATEYFLLITIAGTEYFKNVNWVGFICFSIEPVSRYVGSFDFAYIFYILISCIFKYSFNCSLIQNSFHLSSKLLSITIAGLLFGFGVLSYYRIPMNSQLLMMTCILICLSGLILFWMLKECYFVRKTEE